MKRNFEKGITLVSLVVTIIVLIILAAVSINVIIGQDGIITKAKQAAENMELATLEEQERLNELSSYLSGESKEGGVAYDKIAELNQKYNALNTEYSNFKSTIATAITDMGVTTAEDADSETMSSNIRSLSSFSGLDTDYIETTKLFNVGIDNYTYLPSSVTITLTNNVELLVINVWKEGSVVSIAADSDDVEITPLDTIIGSTGCDTIVYLLKGKIGQSVTFTHTASSNYSCSYRLADYGNREFSLIGRTRTNGQVWTIPSSGKMLVLSNNWREGSRGEGTCVASSGTPQITLLHTLDSVNYARCKCWYIEGNEGDSVKVDFAGGYPFSLAISVE